MCLWRDESVTIHVNGLFFIFRHNFSHTLKSFYHGVISRIYAHSLYSWSSVCLYKLIQHFVLVFDFEYFRNWLIIINYYINVTWYLKLGLLAQKTPIYFLQSTTVIYSPIYLILYSLLTFTPILDRLRALAKIRPMPHLKES